MIHFPISGFLIAASLLLIYILWTRLHLADIRNSIGSNRYLQIAWLGMGLLILLSIWTISSYLIPSSDIYKNTRYHVFEHMGYGFHDTLYLAHSEHPETSLWDDKTGNVNLSRQVGENGFDLHCHAYREPLYIRPESEKKKGKGIADILLTRLFPGLAEKRVKNESFELFNVLIPENIESSLSIRSGLDSTGISIQIRSFKKDSMQFWVRTSAMEKARRSSFSEYINKGFPLSDIILQTDSLIRDEDINRLLALLDGSYLLRDRVLLSNYGPDYQFLNSNLLFFPGNNFYETTDSLVLTVDGKAVDQEAMSRDFDLSFPGKLGFFSGIGFNRSETYQLEAQSIDSATLWYRSPQRFQLDNDATELVEHFITSRNSEVNKTDFPGGYLFDHFSSEDHEFHISGRLKYLPGTARDSMYFNVLDLYKLKERGNLKRMDSTFLAHQGFVLQSDAQNRLSWVFRVNDLRASSPLQPIHFTGFILLFIIFLWLRVLISQNNQRKHGIQSWELAVYIVVFSYTIVKLILLWRMYTFPPLDKANYFDGIRQPSHMWWTLGPVFAFLSVVLIYCFSRSNWTEKLPASWAREIQIWSRQTGQWPAMIHTHEARSSNYLLLHILGFLGLVILCGLMSERFVNIGIPLSLYFLGNWWLRDIREDHIRYIRLESLKTQAQDMVRLVSYFWNSHTWGKILMVFLGIISVTGFVILVIFLTGAVITTSWQKLAAILLFIALLIVGIGIWKRMANPTDSMQIILIKLGIDLSAIVMLCIFDTGFAIVFLMYYFLHQIIGGIILRTGWFHPRNQFWNRLGTNRASGRMAWAAGLVVMLMIVIGFQNTIISSSLEFMNSELGIATRQSYIKYRAKIQDPRQNVSDLILNTQNFQSPKVRQILNASHCQWFINKYVDPENKNEQFFHLRTHFDQGASYAAQTTDLVVSRYIIGEHGQPAIWFLLLLLLLLVWIYANQHYQDSDKPLSTSFFVLLGFPLLIFSVAFFVWLTATNRFTFFGQDFPFISLTSKFAGIFFLSLLGILLINSLRHHRVADYNPWTNRFLFMLVMIGIMSHLLFRYSNTTETGPRDRNYNVNKVIDFTSNKVNEINDLLIDYQNVYSEAPRQGADGLLKAFVQDPGYSDNLEDIFKSNLQSDAVSDSFFQNVWKYFVHNQVNKIDPAELVHMRSRDGVYRLAVNRNYYFVRGAQDELRNWKGNLLGAKVERKFGLFDPGKSHRGGSFFEPEDEKAPFDRSFISEKLPNNINMIRLGKEWSPQNRETFLVAREDPEGIGRFSIYSDRYDLNDAESKVYSLQAGDLFFVYRNTATGSVLEHQYEVLLEPDKYLSRNIWLNGQPKHHYPLGEQFLWAYHMTRLTGAYLKAQPDTTLDSLRLSIDHDLTAEVYQKVKDFDDPPGERLRRLLDSFHSRLGSPTQESRLYHSGQQIYLDPRTLAMQVNPEVDKKLGQRILWLDKQVRNLSSWKQAASPTEKLDILKEEINYFIQGKVDFGITAMDGQGRIRMIVDYNRRYRVNPNNIEEYYAFLQRIYSESTVRDEQDYFGNKNLLHLNPGAGSAVKPLMLSAMSTWAEVDLDKLNLRTYSPSGLMREEILSWNDKRRKYFLDYYGGKELQDPFPIDTSNLVNGLSSSNYLVKSNNLYHSSMIFWGSYSWDRLQREGPLSVLKPLQKGDWNKLKVNFPILNYKGKYYSFNAEDWPDFGEEESALARGLAANYGIARRWREMILQLDSGRVQIKRYAVSPEDWQQDIVQEMFAYGNQSNLAFAQWSLPEKSHFLQKRRRGSFRKGMIQPSLGAIPVSLTPVKVAEMGARMLTRNNNFRPTFTDASEERLDPNYFDVIDESSVNPDYQQLASDSSSRIERIHRRMILSSMSKVTQAGGTAKLLQRWKKDSKEAQEMGLHVYAKTGTLNIPANDRRRGKHLLVLITNTDVTKSYDADSLKFWVVFVSYHSIPFKTDQKQVFRDWDQTTIFPYLDAVVRSSTFQAYMKNE